jgi:hypothetical protein
MITANFTLIDQLIQDPTLSPLYATKANSTTPIEMAERVFTMTDLATLFMFNNPACPVTKVDAFTDQALTVVWTDNHILSWDETTQSGVFKTYELYAMKLVYIQIFNSGNFSAVAPVPIAVVADGTAPPTPTDCTPNDVYLNQTILDMMGGVL